MIQELVFTSAPRGLQRGKSGFCTVASTPGMAANLAKLLESLSGYRHLNPPGSEASGGNPIVYSHLRAQVGGQKLSILSRIADAGMDYSNRSNKIAHHIVIDGTSELPGGPAHLLEREGLFRHQWQSDPQTLPERRIEGVAASPQPCVTWQHVAGDAGWAGALIGGLLTQRPVYLIVTPETPALRLVSEAIDLLPARLQWQATFSTFFTRLPPNVECLCRCVLADSPEAAAAKRNPRNLVIDLTAPLPPAENLHADAARSGQTISGKGAAAAPDRSNIELLPNGERDLFGKSVPGFDRDSLPSDAYLEVDETDWDSDLRLAQELPPPQPSRKLTKGRLPRPAGPPGQRTPVPGRQRSVVPILIGTNILLLGLVLVIAFVAPNWGARRPEPDPPTSNDAQRADLDEGSADRPVAAEPRVKGTVSSPEERSDRRPALDNFRIESETNDSLFGVDSPPPDGLSELASRDPTTAEPPLPSVDSQAAVDGNPPVGRPDPASTPDSERSSPRLIDSVLVERDFSLPRRPGQASVLCRFETATSDPETLAKNLVLAFPSDVEFQLRHSAAHPAKYQIIGAAEALIGQFEVIPSHDPKYPLALEYRGFITDGHASLAATQLDIRSGPDFAESIPLGQTSEIVNTRFAFNQPLDLIPEGRQTDAAGELSKAGWHPAAGPAVEQQLSAAGADVVTIGVTPSDLLLEWGPGKLPLLRVRKTGNQLSFSVPLDRFDLVQHGKLVERQLQNLSQAVPKKDRVLWLNGQYGAVELERKSAGFLFDNTSKLVDRPAPGSLVEPEQLVHLLTVIQFEISTYRLPPLQQVLDSKIRSLKELEQIKKRTDKELAQIEAFEREIEGLEKQIANLRRASAELAELRKGWLALDELLKSGFVLPLQAESGRNWLIGVCSRPERASEDRQLNEIRRLLRENRSEQSGSGSGPTPGKSSGVPIQ